MWRLWHRLFGWHYVFIQWGHSSVMRRVETAPNGTKYVVTFGEISTLLRPEPGEDTGKTDTGRWYRPLTWPVQEEEAT